MDENSNSTVHACVLALESVMADDDSFDLVKHESHKDGLAHSQHGSLQRFPWECEYMFSLSKTLVQFT